jgi:glycosyltransferase involved in cell wall biosynthesis
MRVAVITPFYQTPRPWLEQCLDSVARQTAPCTHFLVCDGDVLGDAELPLGVQVLRLPRPHGDAGNAARAVGSVSAIAQGFDALAYLDADNWYDPDHLRLLLGEQVRAGAAVCSSGRALHEPGGALLGVCPEVDGEAFADTSCLLLTRAAFGLVATWYLMPRARAAGGDRVVWQAVKDSGLPRVHLARPTVHYRTRYLAHYRHFGKEPPPGAKPDVVIPPPAPRAAAVPAAPAGPRTKVSLCLIVRDEEAHLADCLRPVAGLMHEMIVVDTGSADRTREVARGLGARVLDFPWQDSFAAARNEALRHAAGDWIFWLDADDRLDAENLARLERLLALLGGDNHAYLMKQWSEPDHASGSALVVDHVRLFRKQPGVCWRYRVHEQILPALRAAGARLVVTDLVIRHLGYRDAGLRARKLERNLRLLLMELAEQPDEPFTLFNLGGTYLDLGRFEEALPPLRRCLETAPAGATFLPRAHVLLVQGLRAVGRPEEALRGCRAGRDRHPGDAELCFEEGLLRQAAGDAAGAQVCFERLLELPAGPCYVAADTGLRGHLARHQLALAHRAQGRPAEAEAQWRAALTACPQYGPAWLGLAEVYLDGGRPAEAEALLGRLGPGAGPTAAVLRARLALARGDYAAARGLLEGTLAEAPCSQWLRMVLGEVLLREGKDLGEAERQFGAVLATDPKHRRARDRLHEARRLQAAPAAVPT